MLYPTELRGRFNFSIPYTTDPMASSVIRTERSVVRPLSINCEAILAAWNGSGT